MPPFAADADEPDRALALGRRDQETHRRPAIPADEAQIIWMARLARDFAQLRPDNRDYQRQALVLGLEAAALDRRRAISRASRIAIAPTLRLLNDVLADALEAQLSPRRRRRCQRTRQARRSPACSTTADAQPVAARRRAAASQPPRPLRRACGDHDARPAVALPRLQPRARSARLVRRAARASAARSWRCPPPPPPPTWPASWPPTGSQAEATNRGRDAVDLALDNRPTSK